MTNNDHNLPPIDTRFTLGPEITETQKRFLEVYGFLHFSKVASLEEIQMLRDERDRIEQMWFDQGLTQSHGIPLIFGRDGDGKRIIHRTPFTSKYSEKISAFVNDKRFEPVKGLVGPDCRVGEHEKDGVVINRYVNVPGNPYSKLGWHTDGLRDLFYLRMPQQMLNFGIHFDRITEREGGLRLIPGSHTQGFWDMLTRKLYFISHKADPNEITVETEPGDLTVHDGRLWHRVQQSPDDGNISERRSMYVPFLSGPYEPKDEHAKTPSYHHLFKAVNNTRNRLQARRLKKRA